MAEIPKGHEIYGKPFVEQMARSTAGWYHHFKSIELMRIFGDIPTASQVPVLIDVGSNVNASLVGTGPRLAFEMSWPAGRYIGIDLDESAFAAADLTAFKEKEFSRLQTADPLRAERWHRSFLPHSQDEIAGHAIVGAAEALPLGNATADIVLSSDVLEHIPDYRQALRESRRVLKPEGSLILVIPQMYNLNVLQRFQGNRSIIDSNYFTTTHTNFWTPNTLASDLAEEGFALARTQPLGVLMGAAWLTQLDERYAWGQSKANTSIALATAINDTFLWQQLDEQPNAPTAMHDIDHYLQHSPQTLQALIAAAESPVDILLSLLDLSRENLGMHDEQLEDILPHVKEIDSNFSPQAYARFEHIKPFLVQNPYALANDVVFTATLR